MGEQYSALAGEAVKGGRTSFPSFVIKGKYRTSQDQLFLDAPKQTPTVQGAGSYFQIAPRASVSAPKDGYSLGNLGPTFTHVDKRSDWAWVNPGGDWINQDGVAQGTTNPYFAFTANAVSSGVSSYTADITAGLIKSQLDNRWNAYIVKCVGGTRSIATQHHATYEAPVIDVVYAGGQSATLRCTACVQLVGGTSYAKTGFDVAPINTSVALEFARPTAQIRSATLRMTVLDHTASAATIYGNIANPPLNSSPVVTGIAAAYPVDSGISANPNVIAAHRYQDGSVLADWIVPGGTVNVFSPANWSQHLYGLGAAADTSKLPWAYNGQSVQGKWIIKSHPAGPDVSLVDSNHSADGFEPLAPGLGALKVVIPAGTALDGGNAGYVGALGSDLWMLLPEPDIGLLQRLFVRYYMRIGSFTPTRIADKKMFRNSDGSTAYYAISEGKLGIGQHHWTSYGGNDNIGGGNGGWTNRLSTHEYPKDLGNGGVTIGQHAWDMVGANFPYGQQGGLGGSIYPGYWYCVEIDLKLNTVDMANYAGNLNDAEMNVYIDGKLVMQKTGFAYRKGPLDNTPGQFSFNSSTRMVAHADPSRGLAPFRELGHMGIAMNDYNGGTLPSDHERTVFYTGLVVSKSYVGPMAAASGAPSIVGSIWTPDRDVAGNIILDNWLGLPINTWVDVSGQVLNDAIATPPYPNKQGASGNVAIISAWNGMAWDYQNQRGYIAGGGHTDTHPCETGIYRFDATKLQFTRIHDRAPLDQLQQWDRTAGVMVDTFIDGNPNVPLKNGVPSARHTFNAVIWIPPTVMGNSSGGIFYPGSCKAIYDIDTNTWSVPNWFNFNHDADNWSDTAAFIDGSKIYGCHGSVAYSMFRFDLTQTQTTDYATPSFGAYTPRFTNSTVAHFSGNSIWSWLRERREVISINRSASTRVRYGQALDAGTANMSSYTDAITFASVDGSHADFSYANLTLGGPMSSGGLAYDHTTETLYVQPNVVTMNAYKITGLGGNVWTTEKLPDSSKALHLAVNGTYGRMRMATFGGKKFILRVSGVNDPIQVMRVS